MLTPSLYKHVFLNSDVYQNETFIQLLVIVETSENSALAVRKFREFFLCKLNEQ